MIQLQNDALRILIDREGGILRSIESVPDGLEYLRKESRFPNMFPFVGRLYEKRYIWNGAFYPMEMHGFLKNLKLTVTDRSRTACTLMATDTAETRACYPFSFCFRITYRLEQKTVGIGFSVENRGQEALYCAVGGHPGFRVPLEDGLKFEDYALRFPERCQPKQIEFSESILTLDRRMPYPLEDGRRIPLRHSMFSLDALVLSETPGQVVLAAEKGVHGVQVTYPQMPYVGFWQPNKGEPQYLCIEPWSALPGRQDVTETLAGFPDMICVPSKEIYKNSWSISVW